MVEGAVGRMCRMWQNGRKGLSAVAYLICQFTLERDRGEGEGDTDHCRYRL